MTKAEIEALYDQIDGCLLSIAYSGDHSLVGVADALSASKSALQALTDENARLAASIDNPDVVGTLLLARATDQIAAAEARAIAAEEALKHMQTLKRSIMIDVGSCHANRGAGASSAMREDDRDLRRDIEAAFAKIDAALAQKEGGS